MFVAGCVTMRKARSTSGSTSHHFAYGHDKSCFAIPSFIFLTVRSAYPFARGFIVLIRLWMIPVLERYLLN